MAKSKVGSFQNEIASGVFSGVDLTKRIKKITKSVAKESGFIPEKLINKSAWWSESTGIGAFHYSGKFEGKRAVLKVQGVKPKTSEVDMIESFAAQNKSKIIRPPKLYTTLRWNDERKYEAYVMEDVGTNTVIKLPTNDNQIKEFFRLYTEYRKNCRNKPWLTKPRKSIPEFIESRFQKWIKASKQVFPNHPLRKPGDKGLIEKAIGILKLEYSGVDWEFVHGHFSARDLFKVKDQVVLLSNLYWSWRTPYYDTIFAYHWFIYGLANIDGVTPEDVENQRNLWLNEIYKVVKDQRLLKLALLERAAAGLNLDSLSVKLENPIAKHLVEKTRKITRQLVEELN